MKENSENRGIKKFVSDNEIGISVIGTMAYGGGLIALNKLTGIDRHTIVGLAELSSLAVTGSVGGAAIRMRQKPSEMLREIKDLTLHVANIKRLPDEATKAPKK